MGEYKLPQKGWEYQQILDAMDTYRKDDVRYRELKAWSLVYYLGEEYTHFLKNAYNLYFSENALNPLAFKSLRRFESEVVSMTAKMLHGDENVVGSMTSGGTESCLLPVVTYRDYWRAERNKAIQEPQMIAPSTIHVAWIKAAHYFGVKMVHVPIEDDYRANVRAIEKKINENTILIVASAPNYPHGIIDPIAEIGALALKYQIPFHVDACLGGFLLPFVEELGYALPVFDFRVEGVTSMSADVHKYGFAAKGASTLLYRSMDYMRHQIFVYSDWQGGIYASSGLLGTRPGGAIAAAWAAMHAFGHQGYLENARIIMETTRKIMDGIQSIPDLEIVGNPQSSIFAYRSKNPTLNIYAVGDQLENKGWHVDRMQKPMALHAMVTPLHAQVADQFLADLREAVEYVKQHPTLALKGDAALYGMVATLPFRGLIKKNVQKMGEDLFGNEVKLPGEGSTKTQIGTEKPKSGVQKFLQKIGIKKEN
ncbi:MAG: pyridoxal phosphate-dependent decarboxylase family protein [Anaerolineales bacterium]